LISAQRLLLLVQPILSCQAVAPQYLAQQQRALVAVQSHQVLLVLWLQQKAAEAIRMRGQ
jgi:hypothetical protein